MPRRLQLLCCRLLALLLLLNGAVVSAEVSAHGLCDHGHTEGAALHLHSDAPGHDHAGNVGHTDHLCHAHPPLCAAADTALPALAVAPVVHFDSAIEQHQSHLRAPPVPPPNA